METPDWLFRREHFEQRSRRKGEADQDILTAWADEAYLDPQVAVFNPDYALSSGILVRTIGWSDQAGLIVTVITVREESGYLWGCYGIPSELYR